MVNALKFLIKLLIRIPSNRLAGLYFMYEAIIHKLLPQMAGTLRQNLYDKLDGETKTASHGSGQAKVELNIHTPNYILRISAQDLCFEGTGNVREDSPLWR